MRLEPVAAGAALVFLQQLIVERETTDEHAHVGARKVVGGQPPPSSSASQATWSRSRCCGSSECASRGDIPKNCGSNWSILLRNPPRRVTILPTLAGLGS